MKFFGIVILLLILLILFLLPMSVRIIVLKMIKWSFKIAVVGGILYGIVKMYRVMGFRFATKTILLVIGGIILFSGIFHFFVGVFEVFFFLF